MRSVSEVLVASAGGGKTTALVERVLASSMRQAVTTYTNNNLKQIFQRFHDKVTVLPGNVTILSWYSMLIRDFIRPYQNYFVSDRIEGVHFVQGGSARWKRKGQRDYYIDKGARVYSDKVSELALLIDQRSDGRSMRRAAGLYGRIYIDEAQDVAGPGLDLIERMMASGVAVTLVADSRQATYRTNNAKRNSGFWGARVLQKYKLWEKRGLCEVKFLNRSFRCNQAICDAADSLFPDHEPTESMARATTGHDGVFLVAKDVVHSYVARYQPQILRFDKKTAVDFGEPMNFGASKGLEFERVLIMPNGPIAKWLASGSVDSISAMTSRAKLYVALTRARSSVAFVYDGKCAHPGFIRVGVV